MPDMSVFSLSVRKCGLLTQESCSSLNCFFLLFMFCGRTSWSRLFYLIKKPLKFKGSDENSKIFLNFRVKSQFTSSKKRKKRRKKPLNSDSDTDQPNSWNTASLHVFTNAQWLPSVEGVSCASAPAQMEVGALRIGSKMCKRLVLCTWIRFLKWIVCSRIFFGFCLC